MQKSYLRLVTQAQCLSWLGLFIWAYFQDKTKNQHMLEEIKEVVKALTLSNENIARSLEIISTNCASVENKVEKNHEILIEIKNK